MATGSILGSGLGRKGAEVRWGVAGRMGLAWLTTLPAAALVGAVMWWLGHLVGGTTGAVVVFFLTVIAWLAMWVHSRRDPISRHNVNDEWDPSTSEEDSEPVSQGVSQ